MTIGWVLQSPATSPTNRYAAKMAYMPGVGTILVGGTANGSTALHDGPTDTGSGLRRCATWLWSGTNWSMLTPTEDAIAGFGGGLTYDSARNVLVWVPGFDGSFLDYYCEFDGTNWTSYGVLGSVFVASPGVGTVWGNLAYDKSRSKVVLFEGYPTPATWELNTSTHVWANISPTHYPSNYGCAMCYDESNHLVVAWDPLANLTYTYNGTDWTQKSPTHSPPSSSGQYPSMAWDSITSLCLLQLGGQTWSWDGTDWTSVSTTSQTPGTYTDLTNASLAYDIASNSSVYFHGASPSLSNSTYLLTDPGPSSSSGTASGTSTADASSPTKSSGTSAGTSTATATSSALSVTSLSISPLARTILPNQATSLLAMAKLSDSSTEDVTANASWASSDANVARVVGGVVTGVSAGTATITASIAGHSATSSIRVLPLNALSHADEAIARLTLRMRKPRNG